MRGVSYREHMLRDVATSGETLTANMSETAHPFRSDLDQNVCFFFTL